MQKSNGRLSNTARLINTAIAWSKVLLDKLIVTQLVKEFLAFYGTRGFIAVFTRARLWTLP
jgi:hypothetical protein